MHVSTIIRLVLLATAALCENTTLASLVFRNDDQKIARFVERTMPLAGNTITFTHWNVTLALACTRCCLRQEQQPVHVPMSPEAVHRAP